MQLYNTLSRKLEPLTTQSPPEVSLYTCGPTVYDYPHVGNLAAYIRWDLLVRVLQQHGYAVDWVMNITDVGHLTGDIDEGQDKIHTRAQREGKTAWDLAAFFTEDFLQSLQKLNIQTPTHVVKATEHIPQQIALVQKLETKGYTYIIDDGVYFDTSKLPDYGKLAKLKLDDLKAGARVEANLQKRNPTDFALWKFSPKNEQRDMEWESPWGKGFPGWHIECSAMAMEYLGATLDIHTGGIDHIPVHHTNEIAQSEAATGKPFANMWLHSNHIMVDGTKISKSLGNGITLAQLAKQGFDPLDLRMLFLQSHYRSSANFTLGGLQAARQRRENLQAFADLRFQLRDGGLIDAESITQTQAAIATELASDLRTPEALAGLSELVASAEDRLVAPAATNALTNFLEYIDGAFGLGLLKSDDITSAQKELIATRESARATKDFAAADTARDQLAAQQIQLRDTPLGTIWHRAFTNTTI